MPNQAFVLFTKHPFENKPLIFIKDEEGIIITRDVESVLKYKQIVSYEFMTVVDYLRVRNIDSFPCIIDIQTAIKLNTGRKKAIYGSGKEPWELKNIIGKYVEKHSIHWLSKYSELKIIPSENNDEVKKIGSDIMNGISKAWESISLEMKGKREIDRFYQTEVPIYNIFIQTQLRGILIDQDKFFRKLDELRTNYYRSIKKLELEYGFSSSNIKSTIKWDEIKKYCSLSDIKDDLEYDFWEYAEMYSEYDEFLNLLVLARKSNIDYKALLRYCVDSYHKIYPRFDIMGTVTGRILISSPGIQYLKKTSRTIFKPHPGYIFIYADFDQFEPGIIASLSKDDKLIELYNRGDIYKQLSIELFGNSEERKVSKIIFLSYMYGMTKENISKFIAKRSEVSIKGMIFFEKFNILCKWKEEMCRLSKQQGYSSSIKGNRRYLQGEGNLLNEEKRWIPNQIVQGTGSYIFKQALIRLKQESADTEFLIPMYDAILVEVPINKEHEIKTLVKEIFCSEFNKICPEIKANIKFEHFEKE